MSLGIGRGAARQGVTAGELLRRGGAASFRGMSFWRTGFWGTSFRGAGFWGTGFRGTGFRDREPQGSCHVSPVCPLAAADFSNWLLGGRDRGRRRRGGSRLRLIGRGLRFFVLSPQEICQETPVTLFIFFSHNLVFCVRINRRILSRLGKSAVSAEYNPRNKQCEV